MLRAMTNLKDLNESEWLRPADASRMSGLTPAGLAAMARRGALTASKPGGTHRRYLRSEIEALAKPVHR